MYVLQIGNQRELLVYPMRNAWSAKGFLPLFSSGSGSGKDHGVKIGEQELAMCS